VEEANRMRLVLEEERELKLKLRDAIEKKDCERIGELLARAGVSHCESVTSH
jgi:hypothetical protein